MGAGQDIESLPCGKSRGHFDIIEIGGRSANIFCHRFPILLNKHPEVAGNLGNSALLLRVFSFVFPTPAFNAIETQRLAQ